MSALAKGLGRAYLHIQQQPFGDLAELRHACLYHQAYDPQCEADRSEWLIQLIEATGNADDLYAEIFKLTQDLSFDDQVQRFAILGRLAQNAYPGAKAALYRHFNELGDDAQWLGTFEILAVDGLKGLAYIAESLGKRLLADTTQWEDDTLLREAYTRYFQAEVDAYLSKLALSNPFIRAYVQAVQDNTERRRQPSSTQGLILTDESLLTAILEATYPQAFPYGQAGQKASESQRDKLYTHLSLDLKPPQILRFLWVFRWAPLPVIDHRILSIDEC